MTTFAQVYDSTAHNVVSGDTFAVAVAGKYNPQWIQNEVDAGRPWSEVPGVDKNGQSLKHGATLIDGEWMNPPVAVVTVSRSISKAEFQALYTANGLDLTATLAAWPTVQVPA